jgi:transposase
MRLEIEYTRYVSKSESLLKAAYARIEELEAQLKQNSQNSSRPPSSDPTKPKRKSSPGLPRKKKSKGGQKGHSGNTLQFADRVDRTEELRPERCGCGKRLLRQPLELQARRQVFDLPEPKLKVTEYRQLSCTCPNCGAKNTGTFPEDVKAPTQYGKGVGALVSLLSVKCHLSQSSIGELFADLFGQTINTATINKLLASSAEACAPVVEKIKSALLNATVIHVDETGLNIAGKQQWLHVASNEDWTYLSMHATRGAQALRDNLSALFDYEGLLVHDCWSSYWKITTARHSLCLPHLLRELTAQIERGRDWAADMHRLLLDLHQKWLNGESIHRRSGPWRHYRRLCKQAVEEEPPPQRNQQGRLKRTKGLNLALRLEKYQEQVLAFALNPWGPFSNNQAERDLRPAKGKQKVAGCFRTPKGAQCYACIQSVCSTLRKQGQRVFHALRDILEGKNVELAW